QNTTQLFAHLAQRNQRLLDRQIGILAELEDSERDPDRLSYLFELDHLATRVRRNAESLQVIGGGSPTRRWSGPVALGDVVRAAVSEVEDYRRVAIHVDEGMSIDGAAVGEIAHLLAELIENAVEASADGPPVVVRSHIDRDHDRTCTL